MLIRIIAHSSIGCSHERNLLFHHSLSLQRGFRVKGVICPHFIKNESGNAVTVTGERYRKLITNFLWPNLDDIDVSDVWFQQDGTACHGVRGTIQLLCGKFYVRVISRNEDINWPFRRCNLHHFFLWGHSKTRVYRYRLQTLEYLKGNIWR